ncbi:reverse transcriptase family protein [Peribacillus butanolivorans]|uniref:reverse transcriptase family protein n=1 Tax=Peribacillus butanolivorans TaxID=421767 RepID=UPI0036D88929
MKIYSEDFFYKGLLGFDSRTVMKNSLIATNSYQSFELEVNGKKRKIDAIKPNTKLYYIQKRLLKNFLVNIPLPNCVCGFVEGKNYLDFLKPHCNKKYYTRLDIKSFFNSIKSENINGILEEYIQINDEEKKQQILNDFCEIVTLNGSLPQGAVTSPQLSNIFFRRIDIRIRNYCRKFNVEYTRYADDMLFSSNEETMHKDFFIKRISKILKDYKLKLNNKKIIQSENSIVLNGYVVSNKISLSRKKLKKINTFINAFNNSDGKKKKFIGTEDYTYRLTKSKNLSFTMTDDLYINKLKIINYLAGFRSYLMTFSKPNNEDYCEDYFDKINNIEKMLEKLTKEGLPYNDKKSNIAIIIDHVKFGRVNGFNIEVRKINKGSHSNRMLYKHLKMNLNDRTLFVKFYPFPLKLDELINDIDKKALKNRILQNNINEIRYALKINEKG